MKLGVLQGGEALEGTGGGRNMIKIYCMEFFKEKFSLFKNCYILFCLNIRCTYFSVSHSIFIRSFSKIFIFYYFLTTGS